MQFQHKKIFDFAIDRGGTFTDVYASCNYPDRHGSSKIFKLLSVDPSNYKDAPLEAIRRVLFSELKREEFSDPFQSFRSSGEDFTIRSIRMGTTVATNALLERKGARTALLTSRGFRDLLEIGYQNRREIFDLNIKKPKQLYERVVELDERIFLDQNLPDEFDYGQIKKQLEELKTQGIESLAIALMHSYKNPKHEQELKQMARRLGFGEISLSSELVPMIKYVSRASTTVIDAYLAPIIKNYIENFCSGFSDELKYTELLFMKSDGGLSEAKDFRGFNSILSGPAGGITALADIYHQGIRQTTPLIGFDMGGTSTDVSRYADEFNLSYDSEIEGLLLQSPQLDINTVAAGGGSRLFYENGLFRVGPESAGSHPGPLCYKKNGYLAITDANLVLGRINPEFFPKVFGPNADEPLSYDAAYKAFEDLKQEHKLDMSVEEIADGFIKVANETMARPIREVSSLKGFDTQAHSLVCFGGAGAQHAASIAKSLGIARVIIHKYSGVLSAFGIAQAQITTSKQKAFGKVVNKETDKEIEELFEELEAQLDSESGNGCFARSLILRYRGTDTQFIISATITESYLDLFEDKYKQEFGFVLDREVVCDDVLVTKTLISSSGFLNDQDDNLLCIRESNSKLEPIAKTRIYFSGWYEAPVYRFSDFASADLVQGPALIMQDTATIVLEPNSKARLNDSGDLELQVSTKNTEMQGQDSLQKTMLANNAINLAVFSNRFMSIAEQMGKTLERTSISTNIKERRDFSCAIFNKQGDLIANAPHQPVHLGSMGYAVKKQIEYYALSASVDLEPGDSILSNHPCMGGSHLPDLTVITPVFNQKNELIFFVANRAHHADVGGLSPGSMPSFSTKLDQEGIAIKSFKLVKNHKFQEDKLSSLFKKSRLIEDNISDLRAQVAANNQGVKLIRELMDEYSENTVLDFMNYILDNSENMVRELLKKDFAEELCSHDFLDDGSKINLKIKIDKKTGSAVFDFAATAAELKSNLNTPIAVVSSAILYCLRSIINKDIPLNQGFLKPITISVPEGSLLNPSEDAAVVAGNVQTAQRIVDVIFKAFATCAASQGCMNNVIFGNDNFGYYETIGGGAGAGPGFDGASGVHTHMTNTRITDPEILETRYPVVLEEFGIRLGSGGNGKYKGGDGLIRVFKFLDELELSLLSERRIYAPYGLQGGESGAKGENWLLRSSGKKEELKSKANLKVAWGDRLELLTPGGGAYQKI